MDAFNMIQELFTQMQCHFCEQSFKHDDIELLREEDTVFVVNIFCHECNTQNGIAMVGIGDGENPLPLPMAADGFIMPHPYKDPELTPEELERLSAFDPIDNNTVIDAHEFIQNLDSGWMKYIPKEFKHLGEGSEPIDSDKDTVTINSESK